LDVMMPGSDGFEVTRRLKGSSETRDIPIMLITAYDIADYKVIGHEAGADEFLNKPIKAPELKSRVKSLLLTKEYQDKLKRQKQTEADNSCDNKEKTLHDENDISLVLLVFEEENDAKSIKMFLHGQPYQVIIEKTAKDAIALSNQRQIDLILLDVMLQGEECFEICSRLKGREQTANTQILVVSDSEYLENKNEQFEFWPDDFLIKPINVHELRARVKALLKKKTFLDRIYAGSEEGVRSAITDSLSGLANYSYFKYFLEHEIKRSLRDSRPIALMMMELNDVKHNPNCVGHPAGEELLKDLGTLIKENIRDVDLGARCKEKQFAIVLANTDGNGAMMAAERLKGVIKNHFSISTENISATSPVLNIGIAAYPSEAESMNQLIHQAEKELIKSKNEIHPPT
ncbi:MAG: diguanylate cyclase, partial [Proteobacteria bacterium]|nr:diguanylate cyclase [Pseudomonadota bacterium]